MKCPNCGAKMKEGQLYCESCGREIQIVPEFEPEIENSMHATLSDVATQIKERTGGRDAETTDKLPVQKNPDNPRRSAKKKKIRAAAAGIVVLLLLLVLVGFIRSYMPGVQYQKAVKYLEKKEYQTAIPYFERAAALSPSNVSYLNGLAECYYAAGRQEEAKELCLEIISLEGSNEDAYKRLIQIYQQNGKYEEINALMQQCRSKDIRAKYIDLMANPPEFDQEGGTYRQKITVKLIANAAGTIYYTTDGSQPDENAAVYTTPLTLESGTYQIKAVFVNQYGVTSQVAQQTYYLDVHVPEAPQVTPLSGNYDVPGMITVDVPEGCRVYYTTGMTQPDQSGTLYEAPIPMPAGYSRFQFVVCSPGGVLGKVQLREYSLNLHATLSMEAAANQLTMYLKKAGIIQTVQGDLPDKAGHNLYTYKYPLTINDHHYYLYREYYEEASGNSNATGNDYVVNYMSGECYRAVLQEDKTYKLYNIGEPQEDAG